MSNYRRLISYIYAYEGGIKGKNVGFAKLEVRNGQCKIQVNVRNVYIGSQDTGVYLLSGSEEILVGRIFIRNGAGEFRAVVAVGNVAGSGHAIDQCYGLTVHNLSDSWQSYTTIWEDAVAHAAEVALEEATSERVKKEEPVKSSIAEAVEEEIEAQSRKEEKIQQKKQARQEEEMPSSVIPPAEPENKKTLRPADVGVMEIRPMEVLPIGKELTAGDLKRESGEENPEGMHRERENPGNRQEESESKTMQEVSDSMQEEREGTEKELEQAVHGESNNVQENPESVQAEAEAAENEPEQAKVQTLAEQNSGLEEKSPQTENPAAAETMQTENPAAAETAQTENPAAAEAAQAENPAAMEAAQQWRQQPGRQAERQENSPGQPFRQSQWGQPGMLFAPNWFTRSNRQNRPVQQAGQPVPGRQPQEMRTGQPGGQMQPDYEKSGASGQIHSDYQRNQAAENSQVKTSQTTQMAESAAASEPAAERPQSQEAVLQSAPPPAPSQNGPQQMSRPAGTVMPEHNMMEDEPKIDSVWQRFYKTYPKIQAFDYNGGCEIITIKPQDIGLLPRETWGYGNNSFLLHGYYNHRYLIFARLNNPKGQPRFLLGVPGHYYSNEKYMAAMFGFPNFVLSKVQPAGDDRFGYWYTDVRLGS